MDDIAVSGRKQRSPRVSTRCSLGVENERIDAGRDGQTCLVRPKVSGANGDSEKCILPVQLTTSRIGYHPQPYIVRSAGAPYFSELKFVDAIVSCAHSLHVGGLLQIMILRHLQKAGHQPIVLVGGGTTKIGDPSGKDEARQFLDEAAIQRNIEGLSSVFSKFLTFGDGPTDAKLVNNDEWLQKLSYLDFLREYGPHFTINRMMTFDSVRLRLEREQPLTFLEFNYMLLQAYDFTELYRRYGCVLQMGGSDQWGNMVNGVDLGRRVEKAELFAITAPLITTSEGKKMGKSASGAVWLNPDKLPAYDYWQFWRNTDDADVGRFLKLFTELPMDKVHELEQLTGAAINEAKIILADETTQMLHGEACLKEIHQTVSQVFAGGENGSNAALPRAKVESAAAKAGISVVDLFIRLDLAKTKSEVRRLIKGGGAKLNDEKITDENLVVNLTNFDDKEELKLSSGKKKHGIIGLD